MTESANHYLDITGELCPLTFVKTKLLLEKMGSGQILELRLKGIEPLRNVPRSVAELGHAILEVTAEAEQGPEGVHRMMIRKK